MKKLILLVVLSFGVYAGAKAQDIIKKKNGTDIKVKVIEVGTENVKYKKIDNIEGPVYVITKSDVSFITYANGSKEYFEQHSEGLVKRHRSALATLDYKEFDTKQKSKKVIFDYQFDVDRVLAQSEINYYGIDFSSFILNNPKKLGTEEKLTKYLGSWIAFFEAKVTPDRQLRRWMKKEKINLKQGAVQNRNINMTSDWVQFSQDSIRINDVVDITKEYSQIISDTSGVGFVIIIDSFDKKTEKVVAVFNFFDVKTGELLWVSKTVGKASELGMTKYWGIGMVYSLKSFIDKVYYQAIRDREPEVEKGEKKRFLSH